MAIEEYQVESLVPQISYLAEKPKREINNFLSDLLESGIARNLAKSHGNRIPLFHFGHETLYADPKHGLAVEWINGDQTMDSYCPVENTAGILIYGLGSTSMKSVLAHIAVMREPVSFKEFKSQVLTGFADAHRELLETRLQNFTSKRTQRSQ